jgi:hypothetical protein
MTMEKSGCLQLTQEEFDSLSNMNSDPEMMTKMASLETRLRMVYAEIKALLDSGEYRIVED